MIAVALLAAAAVALVGAVHYRHGWAAVILAFLGLLLILLTTVIFPPKQADHG